MANLITDPSFELGTGWTYNDGANRNSGYTPYAGSWVAEFPAPVGGEGPDISQTITVTAGTQYAWAAYVKAVSGDNTMAILALDGATPRGTVQIKGSDAADWTRVGAVFTPTGTSVVFAAESGVSGGAAWLIDSVVVTAVAVKLAERYVDAVVTCLQTNLATELLAIDAERADSVTVPAPASADYTKYERSVIQGAGTHVEVFEGDWDFSNPYVDQDAQRATYTDQSPMPVTVRVTAFMRGGETVDVMRKYKQRYAAGVFNVINKNPRLLSPVDDAIDNAVVRSVRTSLSRETEDNPLKVQATIELEISGEEVQ